MLTDLRELEFSPGSTTTGPISRTTAARMVSKPLRDRGDAERLNDTAARYVFRSG